MVERKMDDASAKYLEALRWEDQHELEMLKRLVAEKQATASGSSELPWSTQEMLRALDEGPNRETVQRILADMRANNAKKTQQPM